MAACCAVGCGASSKTPRPPARPRPQTKPRSKVLPGPSRERAAPQCIYGKKSREKITPGFFYQTQPQQRNKMNTQNESEDMQTLTQYRGFLKGKITRWRGGYCNPLPPETYQPRNHNEAGCLCLLFLLECLRVADGRNHRHTWTTQRDLKTALEQWAQTTMEGGQPPSSALLAKRFAFCGVFPKCKKIDGKTTKTWRGVTFAPGCPYSPTQPIGDHVPTLGTHLKQIRPLFA